ncbi:hypothetical protein Tco_0140562 [Tanacetum coccineum]
MTSLWTTGCRMPICWMGFASTVPGLMTHLVTSMRLDNARSCVMRGTFLTQRKASSILTIFSWGGSISLDDLLPSIRLLFVIIVAVAIVVTVILVAVFVGDGSFIIKLLFVIIVLSTVTTKGYRFSSFKLVDEANSAFRTVEIKRHDKLLTLVTGCFQWLALCFYSSLSDDPPCCKSDT